MTRPCVRCEQELRPAEIETGRRCRRCNDALTDRALDVLLADSQPKRRWWAA